MTPAGWHPDPSGAPGRLRWWDGQSWTEHVHEQAPTTVTPPAPASPLDALVLVVGAPRVATPGTRVFELTDATGGRLGRIVETSRGQNDSAFGAALSRSRGWQFATTRELRGARGYPELVLAWGPAAPGLLVLTRPDRTEVGRLVLGEAAGAGGPSARGTEGGWGVVGPDGRSWGTVKSNGTTDTSGRQVTEVRPDGGGGWRVTVEGGPHPEPLRSLVGGAAAAADVLA